jgi:alcohol dehydrogenase class IV
MLYGSLLAGMALPNSGLGGVHGIAQPLGYKYHLAHGVVCGLLLPYVMDFNLLYAPERYARVAELLGLDVRDLIAAKAAEEGAKAVRSLMQELGIPSRLGELARREDFAAMAEAAAQSSNSQRNPKPLTPEDLVSILEAAL